MMPTGSDSVSPSRAPDLEKVPLAGPMLKYLEPISTCTQLAS